MNRIFLRALPVVICLLPWCAASAGPSGEAKTLRISIAQTELGPTLAKNRDKIVQLTREAAAAGSRVVVFPEGALASPPDTPPAEYLAAVQTVGRAARENDLYVVTGSRFVPKGQAKHHNQLFVFSPKGETLLEYDKVWCARKYDAPRMVSIDGVLCSFIICADRWSRPVEGLPPIMGAKIMIECSNNFDSEWLPALQWYWYVPRALRNTAFVVFSNSCSGRMNRLPGGNPSHGHSAVIAPDGSILAAAEHECDKIITADLDLTRATREMAVRRAEHPLFKDWWEMGKEIHNGKDFPMENVPALVSSNSAVKCGFAAMTCTPSIERNLNAIQKHLRQAAGGNLDLVVFPELAVTGDRREDIEKADAATLDDAMETIRRAVRDSGMTAVVGAPSFVGGRRRNSAYAIGPDGSILTRYDQIVVNRPTLFEAE